MTRHSFQLASSEDPFPNLPIERGRKGQGVGFWVPQMKHTYLAKYIEGTRAMRRKFKERVYLDLFCGPGRIEVEGENFTRLGGAPLAWLHSQKGDAAFTRCITSDLEPQRSEACRRRLEALSAPVLPLCGPAEDVVDKAFSLIPKGALCLVFLDPYNLEYLSWNVIKCLSQLSYVDFAVHFSSADLQRNVKNDFAREGARFDGVAPGWRTNVDANSFYRGDADEAFFDHWCRLIESLGFKISNRLPLIRTERNIRLYHLVFFSRHPSPNRVWSDVAQGINRELF